MDEKQARLWEKLQGDRADAGTPRALISALTPFPFWAVIAAVAIFIPLALILSFVIKRHAILLQGDEIVVLDLRFWRQSMDAVRGTMPLGTGRVELEGSKLTIGEDAFHLEPGWQDAARQLVEANAEAAG